jgi:hypothetical protein
LPWLIKPTVLLRVQPLDDAEFQIEFWKAEEGASGTARSELWCPGEDSNLHALASAST